MHIGQIVQCPADRGEKPYQGKIQRIDQMTRRNINGVLYQWVTVRTLDNKSAHVWPSHRLGLSVIDAGHPNNVIL